MMARNWSALATLLAGLLLSTGPVLADPQLPVRTGAVVDAADILVPVQEQALAAKAANLQSTLNVELVVVTLPGLRGYSIERWGRELGNRWKVGGDTARGVLLIVAPNDREVRIEIGDGLPMPDSAASSIIDHTILPRFRAGDLSGGILAGVDAIAGAIRYPSQLEETGWRRFVPDINWGAVGLLAIAAVVILVFIYQTMREARTWPSHYDYRAASSASYIDRNDDDGFFLGGSHSSGSSGWTWSSSGGGSDSGGSGGGSSGGFSGGGASGRW